MSSFLSRISAELSRFWPADCALCGRASGGGLACSGCRQQVSQPKPRCRRCALALSAIEDETCGPCSREAPAFDATICAVDYAPPMDRLLQALKYGADLPLATLFAELLHRAWQRAEHLPAPELLLPVPLARTRLRERGYNQALEIARPLARRMPVALTATALLRTRETLPQAGLSARERKRNLRGAFALDLRCDLKGRHVAVLDDVMTTGATLSELASLLKRHGAERVTNLVVARTPTHRTF